MARHLKLLNQVSVKMPAESCPLQLLCKQEKEENDAMAVDEDEQGQLPDATREPAEAVSRCVRDTITVVVPPTRWCSAH